MHDKRDHFNYEIDNHAPIQRDGQGVRTPPPPPPEKSQNYRVSQQFCSGHPENRKAFKPAFNDRPSSSRQLNAIKIAFRWRADDGPIIVVFGSSFPSSTKNRCQRWTPLIKLSGSAHDNNPFLEVDVSRSPSDGVFILQFDLISWNSTTETSLCLLKVGKYDQEMPQSHIADQPMAP